jgi:hypothetical protein
MVTIELNLTEMIISVLFINSYHIFVINKVYYFYQTFINSIKYY